MVALADSAYDGIWQDTDSDSYFSVTITGDTVLFVSFDEVSMYQDPFRGAYMGSMSTPGPMLPWPRDPFTIYVKTERLPKWRLVNEWIVQIISHDSLRIYRPLYTFLLNEKMPYIYLRKVF